MNLKKESLDRIEDRTLNSKAQLKEMNWSAISVAVAYNSTAATKSSADVLVGEVHAWNEPH